MVKTLDELKNEAIKSGMSEEEAESHKRSIENADKFHKRIIEEENKVKNDEMRIILGETFEDIKTILKEFCDLKEEYYDLIAVWIIGTYVNDCFNTFPYLFINASRGSGKTRLLKLITALSKNGMLITSVREAVLFRVAKGKTLAIDEFEGIKRKENAPLRELLNACYKKGMKVIRMQRRKTPEGETYIAEEFEPYTPIVMANIEGMDEVVGDRCIQLMLEKSSNKVATRLMEDFDDSLIIKKIKQNFDLILVYMCMCMSSQNNILEWNSYIKFIYNYNTYNTYNTDNTLIQREFELKDDVLSVFNKIEKTGINGRHLELLFPLLIIANLINEDVFDAILKIAEEITTRKKEEDVSESRDVSLIEYVSQMDTTLDYASFKQIKFITSRFRTYLGLNEREDEDINPRWMGNALRRVGLIIDKRRVAGGIEVTLDVKKAKKLMDIYK